MKRYKLDKRDANSERNLWLCPDGEWVKADIAEELYEVVSGLSVYRDSIVPNSLIDMAEQALKKAEEEG